MSHHTSITRGLLLAAISFALGCQGTGAGPTEPAEIDTGLGESFGGLTADDEAPDFGDPAFEEEDLAGGDTDAADTTLEESADTAGIEADPVPPRHVRILVGWGYLRPQPAATETVDWSGSLEVSNAALRVMRTVAFEPGDSIVRPRTSIRSVEFVSQTKPAADGLLLDVVIHPRLNPERGPIVLKLTTGPATRELVLEPGMRRVAGERVDEAGHGIAYVIFRGDGDECEEGYMAGRFTAMGTVRGRQVGELKGRYLAADGSLRGKLRGLYGKRLNGAQVFFAKVIDAEGHFQGILAGRYGEGHFGGIYLGDRDRTVDGFARGMYWEGRADDGGGYFAGRWSLRCGEVPAEGEPASSDEPTVSLEE